ncbi:MAG: hypothetical protein OS130_05085 [Thermodesulfobacteriota bacterium]|nr:MAG: hypothetical protein OS130_05085 [Thermodesulfobacteriota bacterium]
MFFYPIRKVPLALLDKHSQTTQDISSPMMPPGLFDWQNRFEKPDKNGDPLAKLNKVVEWNRFRPALETLRAKDKKPMQEQSRMIIVNLSWEKMDF